MYKRGDVVIVDAEDSDIYPFEGTVIKTVAGVDISGNNVGILLFHDKGWEAMAGGNYVGIENGDMVWWVHPDCILGFDVTIIDHPMMED